jgi:hypothetical protein
VIGATTGISTILPIALLLVCTGVIVHDCRWDIRQLVSARNVFVLTLMAWYVLEACLAPKELQIYTQQHFDLGVGYVVLSLCAFLMGYHNTKGGAFDPLFRRLARIDNPNTILGVFLIACAIGFLPLMVIAKGDVVVILKDAFLERSSRWSSVFGRGRYGGWKDAFLELQMFLRAAVPLAAAVLADRRQRFEAKATACAFLIYMLAGAYRSGTRAKVVEVVLPLAAAAYWRMPAHLKRQAILFGLPAMAVLGLFWSAASVSGRNSGRVDWDKATEVDYVGFEMFRELLYISSIVPEKTGYKYGHTYYVQAVNPIPRALWPSKPVGDAGLELAKHRGMVAGGDAYLTVSPGLLGEMYWNFGVFGIGGLSGLLGYLAKSWDRVRPYSAQSILAFTVFAAGLAIIFLSGRSINMATLYGMLALFCLLVLLSK